MAISRFESYTPSETFKWDAVKQTPLVDPNVLAKIGEKTEARYNDINTLTDDINALSSGYATKELGKEIQSKLQTKTKEIAAEVEKTGDWSKAQRDLKALKSSTLSDTDYQKVVEDYKLKSTVDKLAATSGFEDYLNPNYDKATKSYRQIKAGEPGQLGDVYKFTTPGTFRADVEPYYTDIIAKKTTNKTGIASVNPKGTVGGTYEVTNNDGTKETVKLSYSDVYNYGLQVANSQLSNLDKESIRYRKMKYGDAYDEKAYAKEFADNFTGLRNDVTTTADQKIQVGTIPTPKEDDGGGGGRTTKKEVAPKEYNIQSSRGVLITQGLPETFEDLEKGVTTDIPRKTFTTLERYTQGTETGNKTALANIYKDVKVEMPATGSYNYQTATETGRIPFSIQGIVKDGKLLKAGDPGYVEMYTAGDKKIPISKEQRLQIFNDVYNQELEVQRKQEVYNEVNKTAEELTNANNKDILDNVKNKKAVYGPTSKHNPLLVDATVQGLLSTVPYTQEVIDAYTKKYGYSPININQDGSVTKLDKNSFPIEQNLKSVVEDLSKSNKLSAELKNNIYGREMELDPLTSKYNLELSAKKHELYEERQKPKYETSSIVRIVPSNTEKSSNIERYFDDLNNQFGMDTDGTKVDPKTYNARALQSQPIFDENNKTVHGTGQEIKGFKPSGVFYHEGKGAFVVRGETIYNDGTVIDSYHVPEESVQSMMASDIGSKNVEFKKVVEGLLKGVNNASIPLQTVDGQPFPVHISKSANDQDQTMRYNVDMPNIVGDVVNKDNKVVNYGKEGTGRVIKSFKTEQDAVNYVVAFKQMADELKLQEGK